MTNKKDKEYQFPEDEFIHPDEVENAEYEEAKSSTDAGVADTAASRTSASYATAPSFADRVAALKNKKAVIIIIAVVLVLIIFHFMRGDRTTPTQTVTQQPVQQTSDDSQYASQIADLKQSTQNNQDAISSLQTQVQSLQATVSQMNTQQSQLSQAISALATQVGQLSDQVQVLTKPKPVYRPKIQPPQAKPIVYKLKAVLPGRAWLVGSDDSSISVTVGSKLQQYGTIEAINVEKGQVLTSGGKVISYGQNDY